MVPCGPAAAVVLLLASSIEKDLPLGSALSRRTAHSEHCQIA